MTRTGTTDNPHRPGSEGIRVSAANRAPNELATLASSPPTRASVGSGSRRSTASNVRRPVARRPDGALESEILGVLWHTERALTPAEVRGQLRSELAYTTVMTVLGRLHDKGLVRRTQRGRAFAYAAALSESELIARRMSEALAGTEDHASALTGFVGGLSKRDTDLLRRAMNKLDQR
jgi:predicted transcriptional regulator